MGSDISHRLSSLVLSYARLPADLRETEKILLSYNDSARGEHFSVYTINFYRDASGNEPVREYLDGLAAKNDKDSRIKLNKPSMARAPANRI